MSVFEHRAARRWPCSLFLFAFMSITAQDSIKSVLNHEDAVNPDSASALAGDRSSGQITGTEDQPAISFNRNAYNRAVAGALSLQIKADSLSRMASEKRVVAQAIPDADAKKEMLIEVQRLEREANKVQHEADEKYLEARKIKNVSDTLPGGDAVMVLHKEINGIKVYQYKVNEAPGAPETESESPAVTGLTGSGDQGIQTEKQIEIPESTPDAEEKPIPPLPTGLHGLVYRIQLGVFNQPKKTSSFGGLDPLYVEWLPEKNMYKYFTGSYNSTVSVTAALEKARKAGFPDAFVVAFLDGKPLSTDKAREIEFEELKL